MNEYRGKERRQFLRYDFEKPFRYSVINTPEDKGVFSKMMDAFSKNISASGILFTAKEVPKIASLLMLDLDYQTLKICQEIESRVLIIRNKIVGKVVRIEDNEDGLCGIGIAFIKKSDALSKDIEQLIK
ncbi:MAG: PilZ domain-containing protein [Candidatus Omnitrophica bacterium]|nr:PilZ domain-containing protein [Candidatus Omnitrophota bacterium]